MSSNPYYPPTFAPSPHIPVHEGPITNDLPCRKCSYNLRGLTLDGRCPECGTPVGFSAKGDLIRYSDPSWVQAVRGGISLIIGGVATVFVGCILMLIALGISGGSAIWAPMAFVGALILGYLLILVGTWRMTAADPSGLGEDRYGTSRKLIRGTLLFGLGNTAIQLVPMLTNLEPVLNLAIGFLNLVGNIASIVGFTAQLNYLGKLAVRIPDQKIAARGHFLKFAIPITWGVLLAAVFIMAIAAAFAGAVGAGIGGCVLLIVGLTLLVFLFMYLRMLENLSKRLKTEVAAARASWAATEFAQSVPAQ